MAKNDKLIRRFKKYKNKKLMDKKAPYYKSFAYYRKTNLTRAPFGNDFFTVVEYSINWKQLQSSVGIIQDKEFVCNSAFDPEVATGGTSSRFHQTLCGPDNGPAPYREYRVHAVKCELTAYQQTNTASGGNALVGMHFRLENAIKNTIIDQMQTSRNSTYKYLGNANGNKGVVTLKAFQRMDRMLGVKDLSDVAATKSLYNNHPLLAGRVYLSVESCAIDDLGLSNVNFMLKIKQYIQYLTPNNVQIVGS